MSAARSGAAQTFRPDDIALAACTALGHPADAAGVAVKPVPTGKFNDSFFLSGPGLDAVIRIAPPEDAGFLFYERNMMAQEPGLHALLLERTDVPVAPVLAHDTSRALLPRDFILLQRLPGGPLSSAAGLSVAAVDRVFERVGACLAQVHAVTAQTYGYLGEHRPMEPQPSWRDAFRVMWHKLLDDVEACGGYGPDEFDHMRLLLDHHEEVFECEVPASLLHMDIWHQNILVDGAGELTGIVDWDRALWGDPEIEFAVLDYCGVSTPSFWRGYGRERDQSHQACVRNVLYLLYEVQKYIVIERARRHNPAMADRYRRHSLALSAKLG